MLDFYAAHLYDSAKWSKEKHYERVIEAQEWMCGIEWEIDPNDMSIEEMHFLGFAHYQLANSSIKLALIPHWLYWALADRFIFYDLQGNMHRKISEIDVNQGVNGFMPAGIRYTPLIESEKLSRSVINELLSRAEKRSPN